VNRFAAAHGDYGPDQVVDLSGELGDGRRSFQGRAQPRRHDRRTLAERRRPHLRRRPKRSASMPGHGTCSSASSASPPIGAVRVHPRHAGIRMGAVADAEAKELILFSTRQIFKAMPPKYVDVWKNIVIFDKSAGGAGCELLGTCATGRCQGQDDRAVHRRHDRDGDAVGSAWLKITA
jgi:hypothetical protein